MILVSTLCINILAVNKLKHDQFLPFQPEQDHDYTQRNNVRYMPRRTPADVPSLERQRNEVRARNHNVLRENSDQESEREESEERVSRSADTEPNLLKSYTDCNIVCKLFLNEFLELVQILSILVYFKSNYSCFSAGQ